MDPQARLGVGLTTGSLLFLVAYLGGVLWSYDLGNPIALLPTYMLGALAGPYATVRIAGRQGFGATPFASFLPVLLGSGLAAMYYTWQDRLGQSSRPSPEVLSVFPVLLFPVGLALAFLARWYAQRGLPRSPEPQ